MSTSRQPQPTAVAALRPALPWLKILIVFKLAMLCLLAVNTRFVMDEFWHFSQPVYLFDGTFTDYWPKKAVGYALFYEVAHLIGWDATSMLIIGRVMTAGLAMATVWCIYRLVRSMGQDQLTALIAIAIMLCFSNFIERGFRLRSEPLATLLAAMALLVVVQRNRDQATTLLLAGILSGLAFVTTQKSVYFNFALGAALVIDALATGAVKAALRRGIVLLAGWGIAVLAYGLLLGGSSALAVLHVLFLGPLELALHGGSYYGGLQGFVRQTLLMNPLQYALVAAGILLVALRTACADTGQRLVLVFTVILTPLVFFHSQTWPYVFAMALPFLAVFGGIALRFILAHATRWPVMLALIMFPITVQSTLRNIHYIGHDNRAQLAVVEMAEAQLAADETYFDGIGMIPSRRMEPRLWLDTQGRIGVNKDGRSAPLFAALTDRTPALIIWTYRTDELAPVFTDLIQRNYRFISPHLMHRAQDGDPQLPPAERPDLFEGVYTY